VNRSHPPRRRSRGRRSWGTLVSLTVLGLAVIAVTAAQASAAVTALTTPTNLTGTSVLASAPFSQSVDGVTVSGDPSITMHWSQGAELGTSFDPNLVRQGRSLDPTDSYARTGPGSMSVDYAVNNLAVSWDGIGPLTFSPGVTTSGGCNLKAEGGSYACHLTSSGLDLLDTFPLPGPYVKLKLETDVTVTPQGLATLRQATFGGNPDGTANLTLGDTPITDALAIPCTVGSGDELVYTLGSVSTTPGVSLVTKLVFEVGAELPTPITIAPEIDIPFASPSIQLGTTNGDITLNGSGATFDLGAVQHNNIPPSVNAGGPYSGNEGSPISFDGSGSSSICGFPNLRWDFSDGGVAFGKFPQHTFADNGVYSGQLTATDATGLTSTTTFSVDVANVAPAVNAGPDTTADWGRDVSFNGQATDPGSGDQSTLQYTWSFGDGTPSASGGPSVTHPFAAPGDYTGTLHVCDKDGACTDSTRIVHVTKRDTTTAYLGDTSGIFDTAASLSASLVDEYGQAVNGRSVSFQVGTDGPFNGLTNSSGIATKSYNPTLAIGSYTGSSSFAGDALYNASSSSNSFGVAKKATTTTYTGALSGGPNKTVVLSAVLKDATGKPLAGKTVVFQLGSQSVSATTDANGVASASLKLNQKNGTYPVSATWTPAGADATHYTGSTQSATFKLQAK
jgi:PKD repeat protein